MKLLALTISGPGGGKVQLPGQITTLNNQAGPFGIHIIQLIIDLLIFFAVLLAMVSMLHGGWKWITSEGDKKKLEDARGTLVFSIIGLLVIGLTFLVINILGTFFNVPILFIR